MHNLYRYILLIFLVLTGTYLPAQESQTRSLWVTRWDYHTRQDIEKIMRNAHSYHFNTILFQVRGEATTAYPSRLEPWSRQYDNTDPGWDPLQVALELAHEYNMELHAWINVYPGWGGTDPPEAGDQLYHTHPDWFMVDAWGQRQKLNSHYVWLSPTHPQVMVHLLKVCQELYTRYNIDGIHLDYVRYPGLGFSHDPVTLKLFQLKTGHTPADMPHTWNNWRRDHVTLFVSKLYHAIKEHNPEMVLSASVMGEYQRGYRMYLQDSHGWLARNIIDAVYPMIYTTDNILFQKRLWLHQNGRHDRHIYPGILINSGKQMREQIDIAKKEQCQGVALFAYSKIFPSHFPDPEYTRVLESVFGPATTPAPLPWKLHAGDSQGPVISQIKTIPSQLEQDAKFKIAAYIDDPSGVYDDGTAEDGNGVYLVFDRVWPPTNGVTMKMSRVNKDKNWYITDKSIPPQEIGLDFRCRIFAWDDYHESAGHPKRNLGYSDIWSFAILQSDEHYISNGSFGPRLWRPASITVDPTDNIWVGCAGPSPLVVVSPSGEPLPNSPLTRGMDEYGNTLILDAITSLACTPDGMLYALDSGHPGLLLRFHTSNSKPDTALVLDYIGQSMDCDDKGNLFIMENLSTRWHVHNSQGVELSGSPFGELHAGQDIAVLRDGASVFVNDLSANAVQLWHGAVEANRARYWRADDLPAVDMDLGHIRTHNNDIFVSHSLRGIITIYDRSGSPVTHLSGGNPPLYAPIDLAVAGDGKVFYTLEASGNGPAQLSKWSR